MNTSIDFLSVGYGGMEEDNSIRMLNLKSTVKNLLQGNKSSLQVKQMQCKMMKTLTNFKN